MGHHSTTLDLKRVCRYKLHLLILEHNVLVPPLSSHPPQGLPVPRYPEQMLDAPPYPYITRIASETPHTTCYNSYFLHTNPCCNLCHTWLYPALRNLSCCSHWKGTRLSVIRMRRFMLGSLAYNNAMKSTSHTLKSPFPLVMIPWVSGP